MERVQPTAEDGRQALRDHVAEKASEARRRLGAEFRHEDLVPLVNDGQLVRYPTEVCFDATALAEGEFGHAEALGDHPSEGFRLYIHPHFEGRSQDVALLAAYHLVRVNYGDIATHLEAELYGATLLGLEVDDYYRRVCELADELAQEPAAG